MSSILRAKHCLVRKFSSISAMFNLPSNGFTNSKVLQIPLRIYSETTFWISPVRIASGSLTSPYNLYGFSILHNNRIQRAYDYSYTSRTTFAFFSKNVVSTVKPLWDKTVYNLNQAYFYTVIMPAPRIIKINIPLYESNRTNAIVSFSIPQNGKKSKNYIAKYQRYYTPIL